MRYVLTGALLLIAGSTPTAQDVDAATLVALEIPPEYSNVRRFEVSVEQTIELPQ